MTVEDAIQMMGVLEAQHDGTPRSAERIKRLNGALLRDPSQFFEAYWEEVNADDPMRAKAEELYRQLGPDATFGQMKQILNEDGDEL
jgi:hypothetical protein